LENHLILTTYREILQAQGAEITPLLLRIRNDIPIGKGCGSSAAARLAGIALANYFGGLRWTDAQIIGEASRREHHPDNASACWMGGLAVARMSGEAEAQVACIRPKGKWPLLLAVPEQALSTEEARRVLPAQYSRADAVVNIQNSMLLLAAFTQDVTNCSQRRSKTVSTSLTAPSSVRCCPACRNNRNPGYSGVALSGAGPSVVIFSRSSQIRSADEKPCCRPPRQQETPSRIASHLHYFYAVHEATSPACADLRFTNPGSLIK